MPNIKGTWQWDDNPQVNVPATIDQNVNFTSNGENFERIEIRGFIRYYYAGEHDPEYIDVTATGTWTESDYKYIDFGTTDQTVGDDFYGFIEENAAPYMSVQIGAVYPVTLLTRDKYVDKNIRVLPPPADEPVLEEKTVTPNDEIQVVEPSQGYDALSKVTVNAVPTEEKTATPTEQQQLIEPSEGQYLSSVTVEAIEATEKNVTENGEYTPDTGTYYKKVNVNVPQYTDISSTTAQADDVLEGEYFFPYNGAPRTEGTIPVRTASNPEFTSKNDSVTFQEGYYPEASTVQIAESEKAKIIPENIKDGEVILGVTGSYAGGGMDINGAINEYVVNAGANVNAGDFVEFVQGVVNQGTFNNGSTYSTSAVALSDSQVLVAYSDGGNSSYGTAVVLTISGTTISVGNKVVFNSGITNYISAAALSNSQALVAYRDGGNSDYGTAIVLTISGTTISVGTETVFNSRSTANTSAVALSDSQVLVAYSDGGNSSYGTAVVLTISGTTISVGNKTVFNSGITSYISAVALSNSQVLVAYYGVSNSRYVTAVVLTISGTTISVGTETIFHNGSAGSISAVALSNSQVLVAYWDNISPSCGTAVVLTISGTTISVGNKTVFNSGITSYISAVALNNSQVLVAYSDGGNSSYGTAVVLTISGTTISVGTETVFNNGRTSYISAVVVNENNVLITYCDVDNSLGDYALIGEVIQPATTRDNYVGVAKTSGTAGQTVEVYEVPLSYTVTVSKSNCTNTSVTSPMKQTDTQTITFTANTAYELPENITVTNCEYIWNNLTGELTITNLTGNVSITVNAMQQKLDAPVISISGSVISWSAVANATSYGIFADNQPFGASTTGTSFDLADYEKAIGAGTKNITVNAQGSPYAPSDASNAVSYTVIALSAPTLTWTAASGLLTWTASENAESYTVYEQISSSDWSEVTTTTATYASIDFDAGAHTMAVKATSTTKVDSALSNAVTVNVYGISTTLTGVTGASGNASKIYAETSETLTFTADDGYTLPETITVTNAQYTWNNGTLTLSNPTGNVTVTITGVQEQTPLITNPLNGATISSGYTYVFASGFTPTTVKLNGTTSSTSVTETIVSAPSHGVMSPDSTVSVSVDGNVSINSYLDYASKETGFLTCNVTFSDGSHEVSDTFIAEGTASGECFVKGTKISLADGTVKNVEDIRYDDNLLVWDFDNARYASASPLWIKQPEKALYYYKLTFESGRVLKVVGSDGNAHRLFSLDDNAFVYSTQLVGKRVYTENGIDTLKACERIEEEVEFYNIITKYHMNLFAENVLTSCRYSNLYPIKDMRYIREERDIIPYSAYSVPREYYDGLRLGEQKIKVSDTNKYVSRLVRGKL